MMKIYSMYDNMHKKCINYALNYDYTHVITRKYCMLSTRLDSLLIFFFKEFWVVVKSDVLETKDEFRQGDCAIDCLNHS